MGRMEDLSNQILSYLLKDFRQRGLSAADLTHAYEGCSLADMRKNLSGGDAGKEVDFDVALKDLENTKKLIGTGPMVPYPNEPGSGVVMLGAYSKREYVYLTEEGYKAA